MSWKNTDPVTVWKSSTIVPIGPKEASLFDTTKPIPIRSGRNEVWQYFTELRSTDQRNYMDLLIKNWPFKWERRAFQAPPYIAGFMNSLTSVVITHKMISQAVYNGVYTRFFDVIKRSQKFPFLFSFYAGGLTTVALWQVWIKPRLIDEEELCFPCVLARTFCLLMLTGTLSPLVSGPWLVHFMITYEEIKNLKPKNIMEAFILTCKYAKYSLPLIPRIVAIQAIVSAACVYSSMWSRQRIFKTFDIDPEIVRDAIHKTKPNFWVAWIRETIAKLGTITPTNEFSIFETSKYSRPTMEEIEKKPN